MDWLQRQHLMCQIQEGKELNMYDKDYLIELLKKEEPKPPYRVRLSKKWHCPTCHGSFSEFAFHCPFCKQSFNWEEFVPELWSKKNDRIK